MNARWRSVVVEIALVLGAVIACDLWLGDGTRFWSVEPHPFWIAVVLMAAQYGTAEALVAAAVASVALLWGNLPAQRLDQDVHAYRLALLWRPLLWTLAALILGEVRMRHQRVFLAERERLLDSERRLGLLANANEELTDVKRRLETRLAGQLRTALGLYQAARRLEQLDPDRVMHSATELVRAAVNPKAFSLFLLEAGALRLAVAEGWTPESPRMQSFGPETSLFHAVVGQRQVVSIAHPDGERALDSEGLVAGPLVHPDTGEVVGMLKMEEMNFLDLNFSTLQTFRAVGEWVGVAYLNAMKHRAEAVVDDHTALHSISFFDREKAYLTHIAKRFNFDLSVLILRVDPSALTPEQQARVAGALGEAAQSVLRRTDLAFDYRRSNGEFAVLLPGAPPDSVWVVAEKLSTNLSARVGAVVECSSRVQSLHRASEPRAGEQERGHLGPATVPRVA
jgi:GGDEF domain-containing protein